MTPTTSYLIYLVFTLGAAAVYFLLPRPETGKRYVGLLLGLAALGALVAVLASEFQPVTGGGFFYLFSVIAIAAAVRVITHPRPVFSALYFVVVVVAVAALLVLLQAEFAAVALIMVYAGAIMVTYLFVIMLAQQPGSKTYDRRAREPFFAVLMCFVLMAAVAGRVSDLPQPAQSRSISVSFTPDLEDDSAQVLGNSVRIGTLIMTKYVVALQIGGVLLLISMVGAIAMSRKKIPVENAAPTQPLGQIGKEVSPW